MIITNTNIAGRIVGAAFAAAVLIGVPLAAMTVAPTAHAGPGFISCPNGLPNDCDGDGFSDLDERELGTNPLEPTTLDLGFGKKHPVLEVIDTFDPFRW